uniref:dUTPase-like domain-containing protein n=1 Tax=Naja naja TaxID=35670 RepID=A0A8C6XSF5_NAJNA
KPCQRDSTNYSRSNLWVRAIHLTGPFHINDPQARPATQGSAGIDLPLAGNYNLDLPGVVQICDTQLQGPLPEGTVGLVLPRSSTSKRGIQIIPGVIDSDYEGIVKIQVISNVIQQVVKGEKLAQLILLPYRKTIKGQGKIRGSGGFGSTDPSSQETFNQN